MFILLYLYVIFKFFIEIINNFDHDSKSFSWKDFLSEIKVILYSYSAGRLRRDTYSRGKMFPLFSPPFQKFFGINDTSFESPNTGRLEFAKKLGAASF